MSMKTKVEGVWKEIDSFYCKRQGQWKLIEKIYEKDGENWKVVFQSPTLIDFYDYPYPIPVMAGWKYRVDGGSWVNITANGQINSSGVFSGRIRAFGTLTLSNYTNVQVGVEYGDEVYRTTGTALSQARTKPTSFVINSKGYVCGGGSNTVYSNVDIYDLSGNRTTGTSLSVARGHLTSFVNAEKGYVCGGYGGGNYYSTVDIYDSSENRTTGTSLSQARQDLISFVNNSKGYVCGGNGWDTAYSNVDIYDSSGNRTTGTSLSMNRHSLTSFVNNSKGYVCGGGNNDRYDDQVFYSNVDIYDLSGNRTTGTSLSVARGHLTSFVNAEKGYVCGGSRTSFYATDRVDIYNSSGNRTTGTALSQARMLSSSFVNNSKGYVCGGADYWNGTDYDAVDIYDSSGNRTTGTALSTPRAATTSFVNANKGYVCGGGKYYTSGEKSNVDIYYNEEIPIMGAKLPITAGTSYTLNGISGTAPASEVLNFNTKVNGTIEYQTGVLARRGLVYDKSSSDPFGCLTYIGMSNLHTPMSCGEGNANEGSWASDPLFNAIEVGYLNGSTWVADSKSAMTGSTTYNCFTRIPKIYQRVTKLDDNRVELIMDTKPFTGATLHPAFIIDGAEVNYKFIGRFLGRNVSSKLTSTSGGQPTVSLTRADFRTLAKANGSNYGLMSYYDWDLVNKLFLLAFRTFDSQSGLGAGYTGRTSLRNTGSSNGRSWNVGWDDNTTVMSFIGIEDWWGNAFQFIDNFLTDASYIYAGQSSNPTDSTDGMKAICPNLTLSGVPLKVRGGLNDFFIAETSGGTVITGLCDEQYYDQEVNGGRVGAYYGSSTSGGAFYLNAQNSISSAGTSVGARLVHWE